MANNGKTPVFAINGKTRKEWRDVDTAAADLGYATGSILNAITKGYPVKGWTFDYVILNVTQIEKILSRPRTKKQAELEQLKSYRNKQNNKG